MGHGCLEPAALERRHRLVEIGMRVQLAFGGEEGGWKEKGVSAVGLEEDT